jgi:hypothetical protein
MAKYVLTDADVDKIIDTIASLTRNSLPSGVCPYAALGNGRKCIEEGCDAHQEVFWENFFEKRKDNESNKRIYIMRTEMFEGKHIQDMSDAEIKELCAKDKDAYNHDVYDSVEELSAYWNTEEIFSPFISYMRVIKE